MTVIAYRDGVMAAGPYHAAGSGMEAALGAMFAGASAEVAARAAIVHTTGCGGDVAAVSIEAA